jgi:hypothetical protein
MSVSVLEECRRDTNPIFYAAIDISRVCARGKAARDAICGGAVALNAIERPGSNAIRVTAEVLERRGHEGGGGCGRRGCGRQAR